MSFATINYIQLPYRHGTGTITYCRAIQYRTLQYLRYMCLLKARLGHGLRDTLVHGRNEATYSQSVCVRGGGIKHQFSGHTSSAVGGEGDTTPPLPQIHSVEECMHILHTHSHEGFS